MSQKYTDNLNKQTQAGRGCDITCGFPREHVRVQGSLPFLRSARRRKNVSRSGRRERRQGGAEVGWAGGWEWFAVAPVNRAKPPQKLSTSRTLHKPHTEQKTYHLLDFHLYVSLKVIISPAAVVCNNDSFLVRGGKIDATPLHPSMEQGDG